MSHDGIEFHRFPYDDSAWHVELRAHNHAFSAAQEFYTHAEDLRVLGVQFADFTGEFGTEVRFELGDRTGKFAHYILLRAFSYDSVGHAALEFAGGNCGQPPYRAEASFSIFCDVAGINRLGEQLRLWAEHPIEPLLWTVRSA